MLDLNYKSATLDELVATILRSQRLAEERAKVQKKLEELTDQIAARSKVQKPKPEARTGGTSSRSDKLDDQGSN